MDLYIEDRRIEGKNTSKMKHQWVPLKETFNSLQPAGLVTKMTVQGEKRTICHAYAVAREKDGAARDTINSELSLIRSSVKWAAREGHIKVAPKVWVPPPGPPRETAFSEDEIARIFEALAGAEWHVRLVFAIALATGARSAAILDLTWDRVNFERRTIDFRLPDQRSILETHHMKGRSEVDIGEELATIKWSVV